MKQFDVQRIESLMRYTEFLIDVKAEEEKISQIIDVIHGEVIGYLPEVNEENLHADGQIVHSYVEIHPEVRRYVQDQIKFAALESERLCQKVNRV